MSFYHIFNMKLMFDIAMLFLLMFGGWPMLIKGSLGACVVWRVHEHQQEQHAMLFLLMFNINISRNNMPCCSC